jgi:hypothetical protein
LTCRDSPSHVRPNSLIGSAAGRLRSRPNPRKDALHILIRRRLQPCIGRPCGVVFAKHVGDSLGIDLLSLDEKAISFLIMANGLLVQALFGQPAGLRRWTWTRV